ncbi:HD-GYP domain-containing protein [Aminipila luticellarii]|uniref:HD domain-containing protein n=1 Tax=Aminipila luticellarii TaxID=2507160 RepID=A0A410PW27_9FIRM|nr:HD domain-containing phosphohydrolase [Aminipila luticellarii]QAT43141.1 HD domain-containing protein [Aminipila luticellarii]
MKLSFNDILYAFSYALDRVEHELIGVTTHHGKRVAWLCILMGRYLKMPESQLMDLSACAVLHDNALTEYIQSEYRKGIDIYKEKQHLNLGVHCIMGEKNIKKISLCPEAENAILYHHENADGSGSFGKTAEETPLFAQLIHMADQIDANWDLSVIDEQKYEQLLKFIDENKGILFSDQCVEVFHGAIHYQELVCLKSENLDGILGSCLKDTEREYTGEQIIDFAGMFANIIDYKSRFTRNHSLGIAEKAAHMARYYGYKEELVAEMFLTGAVHDIGKLVIDKDILEKPDKLTDREYKQIQNHAYYTYEILRKIKGFEEITKWASHHHEKLNGKGYPFGKTADELGFNERLMACLDIYQALTEKRPYKEGFSHERSMSILRKLVKDGSLDGSIVEDIEKVYGN